MNPSSKKIAFTAVISALSLVLLALSSSAPSAVLGLAALAGVMPAVCVTEFGLASGFACYGISGFLGLLLLPRKSGALAYILFLGLYPVLKSLFERIGSRVGEYCLKLADFNLSLAFALFFLAHSTLQGTAFRLAVPLVFLIGNAVFIAYDIGLSQLISFYLVKVRKRLR